MIKWQWRLRHNIKQLRWHYFSSFENIWEYFVREEEDGWRVIIILLIIMMSEHANMHENICLAFWKFKIQIIHFYAELYFRTIVGPKIIFGDHIFFRPSSRIAEKTIRPIVSGLNFFISFIFFSYFLFI